MARVFAVLRWVVFGSFVISVRFKVYSASFVLCILHSHRQGAVRMISKTETPRNHSESHLDEHLVSRLQSEDSRGGFLHVVSFL